MSECRTCTTCYYKDKVTEYEQLLTKDQLTGLYNYRFFTTQIHIEAERAKREGSSLCLAMMDIDFFSKINNIYGHDTGNHVLAQIGDVLNYAIRKTDYTCRFGGDEFAVILPNTTLERAQCIMKRVKDEIYNVKFGEHETIHLSASIGIAEFSTENSSIKGMTTALIKDADDKLYSSKEKRNEVT